MDYVKRCFLKNLASKQKHILNHKEVFILGRNKETRVEDMFVSKNQIACFADLQKGEVKLKPIGEAISGINGFALKKNIVYTVVHGDIIELRFGHHKFEVTFDPEDDLPQPPVKKFKAVCSQQSTDLIKPSSSTRSNDKDTWEAVGNSDLLIFTPKGCKAKSKIAAFDIDGTIIKTKSGARFPKNMDDWTFYFDHATSWKNRLKSLFDTDYKIVFFTNQSGVGKDISKIQEFKSKIEKILSSLNLPIQVFIATGKPMYRKPRPGMWNTLVEEKNDGVHVDKNSSFFVGDAAGREKNWAPKRNKDHSCADRLFAINIGIKFYTPEEYFLNSRPASFKMPEFDPRKLPTEVYPDVSYDKLNVVLMVGGPGSGKSFFCKTVLVPQRYVYVNRDELGSWQKCVKAMESALESGKNVVIDNTNGSKESRKRFIDAAKNLNADVRCFVMNTSLNHMRHNNIFRELTDKSHVPVSDIIIFSFNKNYQAPEMSEGYAQLLRIPFVPKLNNSEHQTLYKMFLLEK